MTKPDLEATPAAIHRLLEKFEQRLADERVADVVDWLDHREWELAFDSLADSLFEADLRLDASGMLEVREILARMGLPSDKYAFLAQHD